MWGGLLGSKRFLIIAGPCVIESASMCFLVAQQLKAWCGEFDFEFVFKASYDKANRTSSATARGPGLDRGLRILGQVRDRIEVPVLTDVHTVEQAVRCGRSRAIDVLQIPAFLCRQTDLIIAAAKTGRVVNLKKGQFLSPGEMTSVVRKAESAGCKKILVTERGTTFGYNNLVADMRSIPMMQRLGYPVIFDATHSVQLPGAGDGRSGGQREFAPVLARAAVAAGADGVFIETHPEPDRAPSDGQNMIPLRQMRELLRSLGAIRTALRGEGKGL